MTSSPHAPTVPTDFAALGHIFIGFDPREVDAYMVALNSVGQHRFWRRKVGGRARSVDPAFTAQPLNLRTLRNAGLFYRPQEMRDGRIWDLISDNACATEFSISRFLVPELMRRRAAVLDLPQKWAIFMDCDMLALADLTSLFGLLDPSKALYCVQHEHQPVATTKMGGQVQSSYPRKNWSSFMVFNCDHPANQRLTIEMVNTLPGSDLHRFCWLEDSEIGALPVEWNWLVGHSAPLDADPKIVHFTDGVPSLPGYENVPYADHWWAAYYGMFG